MFNRKGILREREGSPTLPTLGGLKYILHFVPADESWDGPLAAELSQRWPFVAERHRLWYRSKHGVIAPGSLDLQQVQSDVMLANLAALSEGTIDEEALAAGMALLGPVVREDSSSVHLRKDALWEALEPHIVREFIDQGISAVTYIGP